MNKSSSYIPKGYHSLTPLLTLKDVSKAIEFYNRAFGAIENFKMIGPDGKTVVHAEIQIGDSVFMLGGEMPGGDCKSVETFHGSPVGFCLYVKNVEDVFKVAVNAGAREAEPVKDQFWGDRMGTVTDPFGFNWSIATHQEDLSADEIHERAKSFFAKAAA